MGFEALPTQIVLGPAVRDVVDFLDVVLDGPFEGLGEQALKQRSAVGDFGEGLGDFLGGWHAGDSETP